VQKRRTKRRSGTRGTERPKFTVVRRSACKRSRGRKNWAKR
jgi:hypothetical protein